MGERNERERRALEALIVSRLRAACDEAIDPQKLPAITAADREKLECLKPDFIDRLLARSTNEVVLPEPCVDPEGQVQQPIGGLCRADEYEENSADEVATNRREIRRKLKEDRDGERNQPGS